MAQQLKTDIILNLAGNLAAKAKQYGASMSDFARKNERAMTLLKTSANAAGRGIDSLGNRYVGLATAFATGATVRNVAALEAQMVRIGTNAKLSSDQVSLLTKQLEAMSVQKDIRIGTDQLAAGVDELLGKTGDFEFVQENLENMGLFMQAFGADARSTGALFAQFREKGIRDAKDVMNTIDELYGQFAIGSVNVKDLADISEQLFATYQGKGPEAISQMSALVQLFAKAKGNANESLTSIQAVFATFSDKKKVEFLNRQGIEVFKKGTKELREPVELLLEILDKAKNDPLKLGDVFDQTSLQGLASLYSQENKDLLRSMISGTAEMGATQEAAAKNAATLNAATTALNNSFNKFANERLAEPIQELADAINSVDDETIQNWLKWGETALWVVGGLVAAKKGLDMAATIKDVFGKKPGAGGAAGGGFADLGVMPVYVVNMPGGGMGGAAGGLPEVLGGDGKPTGKPTGKPSAKSKWPSIFSKQNLAAIGTIGYASTMIPEWSPIDVRRASEVDRTGLPENFVTAPGLLDVWDELKGLFSGSSNGSMAGNSYMAGQTGGEMKLKVEVSDDRVKVTPTYLPKGFTIDPDMGAN
ncbi:phage tail length tape measure protein [Vibrio cholerae]|uniref:phage tail length tape measure protein n=1 Tax=Vibrio cholerae TaxID=666 RepID=UPI000615E614|nr:phage tail length tape measure protein [Vibrio cholerae]AKB05113.1 phage-related minor tail family protein [Vibrio cholerae]GHY89516.1 phage-related minor tail family protein [Vibrio cholerae]